MVDKGDVATPRYCGEGVIGEASRAIQPSSAGIS
jgi:hypothetical protein